MFPLVQNKKPLENSWGLVSTGKSPVLDYYIRYFSSKYNILLLKLAPMNIRFAQLGGRNLLSDDINTDIRNGANIPINANIPIKVSADLKASGQDYFSKNGEKREVGE